MSMKLVRKFLQQDENYGENLSGDSVALDKAAKRKRKRQRNPSDALRKSVTDDDMLQATVHSMLYLDQAMVTFTGKSDSKNKTVKRIQAESKKARKNRKTSKSAIMGNSRSSSSQMRLPSIPTFNKKRYKREQEEKRLQEIAKLLNKQKRKKMKTASKSTTV